MPEPTWTCPTCDLEHRAEMLWCSRCHHARYISTAVMLAEHVLEHIADGLVSPLDILKAMTEREYEREALTGGRALHRVWPVLTLQQVASHIKLLTRDTTKLAQDLAKAHAARVTLDVLTTGKHTDQIAIMKGWRVLGDEVRHTGEVVERHVVELHSGPPPAPDAES
jgi:hypothetical protein